MSSTPEPGLPPAGTFVRYEYDAAYPTPCKREQLLLVTGHEPPTEEGQPWRVRALPIAHLDDQQAVLTVDQLAPV